MHVYQIQKNRAIPVTAKDKIYVMNVSLLDKPNIVREIHLKGNLSLYGATRIFLTSFGFYFDHCFGYYSALNGSIKDSKEAYELFADLDDLPEGPVVPHAKGVQKIKIRQVFSPTKKMRLLFDYGDDWEFLVECLDVIDPLADELYPKITARKGSSPVQYPCYEETCVDHDSCRCFLAGD
jgi:hypothetical protein